MAFVDQGDAHTQGGENAGVLESDDARADHGQCSGQAIQAQDVVAATDLLAVEGNARLAGDLGAGGEDDIGGGDVAHGAGTAPVVAVYLRDRKSTRLNSSH